MSTTPIRFRRRRILIATLLFTAGVAVYLTQSGAPPRVHIVTVLTEFALAAVSAYFVSNTTLRPSSRLSGMVAGLVGVSLVTTWASSRVIAALNPLQGWHFVLDLGATFLKATLLVATIWIIDTGFEFIKNKRGRGELAVVAVLLLILSGSCTTVAVTEEPQVLSSGDLPYPSALLQRGVEGLVKVEMIVGTDGVPRGIRVLRDDPAAPPADPLLEKFAIETVSNWRFRPASANGKAIERRYVTAIHVKPEHS